MFESEKDDIISGLQNYLYDKLWIDIKFIEGVEKISREFNS